MAVVPFRKDVSWEDAAAEFIYFKIAEGRAERTIEDYKEHIARFFKRFPDAFDPQKARKCVLEYMSDKIRPATYNIRLAYLRSFFSWCVNEGILPENPTAGLKRRKDGGRIVSVEDGVLIKLLELPDKQTFTGLRDYALMLLTLDTGALGLVRLYLSYQLTLTCVRGRFTYEQMLQRPARAGRFRYRLQRPRLYRSFCPLAIPSGKTMSLSFVLKTA